MGCDLLLPQEHRLVVEIEGFGTTTPLPGTYMYEEVTVVELEAEPADGWRFIAWEGDVAEFLKPSTTVSVEGETFVKAFFEEIPKTTYTLTIDYRREGEDGERSTVSPSPGTHSYKDGERVQIEALPGTGWSFSHWEGDLQGIDPRQEIIMTENRRVTAVFSFFNGGVGGDSNPFLIATPGQLYNIRNHITPDEKTFFKLVADIDLSAYSSEEGWKPIGLEDDGTVTPFLGSLNGNGYAITNLSIHRPQTSRVGLFAHLSETGRLESVILNRVQTITGYIDVGALAGVNEGEITHSYVSGSIETIKGGYCGGLVGRNEGTVVQCYSDASVSGIWDTGGLVGINFGSIEKSHALGSVTGEGSNTGGLVGRNEGTIRFTYATGLVSGDSRTVGGLVGTNVNGEVRDSYYDESTTEQSDRGKGEPKPSTEMKRKETYINWDFTNTWSIEEGETYPYLRWKVF